MADVTISQLANATPNTGGIIPISQGGVTYSTALAQLSSLPFIPKAWVSFDGSGAVGQNCTIHMSYGPISTIFKNSLIKNNLPL